MRGPHAKPKPVIVFELPAEAGSETLVRLVQVPYARGDRRKPSFVFEASSRTDAMGHRIWNPIDLDNGVLDVAFLNDIFVAGQASVESS